MKIEDYKEALQFAVSGLRDHGLTTHDLIALVNPATAEATGPKVEYVAPDKSKGRWRRRADMSEVFVPGEAWSMRVDEPTPEREPSVPDVLAQIQRTGNTGSHIGAAGDGRAKNLESTGPQPVQWQEPKGGHYEPYGMQGQSRWVPDNPDEGQ